MNTPTKKVERVEAVVEEFKKRIDASNFEKDDYSLVQEGHLLDPEAWPESKWEIDGDKVIDWLRTQFTTLIEAGEKEKRELLIRAIENIEIARTEHNDARHGNSTDDAYDRACDAINPELNSELLCQ